jgi:hypothetical protein
MLAFSARLQAGEKVPMVPFDMSLLWSFAYACLLRSINIALLSELGLTPFFLT